MMSKCSVFSNFLLSEAIGRLLTAPPVLTNWGIVRWTSAWIVEWRDVRCLLYILEFAFFKTVHKCKSRCIANGWYTWVVERVVPMRQGAKIHDHCIAGSRPLLTQGINPARHRWRQEGEKELKEIIGRLRKGKEEEKGEELGRGRMPPKDEWSVGPKLTLTHCQRGRLTYNWYQLYCTTLWHLRIQRGPVLYRSQCSSINMQQKPWQGANKMRSAGPARCSPPPKKTWWWPYHLRDP